jgi:hypothetical protein
MQEPGIQFIYKSKQAEVRLGNDEVILPRQPARRLVMLR